MLQYQLGRDMLIMMMMKELMKVWCSFNPEKESFHMS
jgi:hypothetical protein